jgi:peptidoglycan/LPS O-acetylase OafA/YrhL
MNCHGSYDETSTHSGQAQERRGGWHLWLMLACCLAPLAAIAAISLFAIPGSTVLSGLAALLCPLMMVVMMLGMGHNHGSRAQEPPAQK